MHFHTTWKDEKQASWRKGCWCRIFRVKTLGRRWTFQAIVQGADGHMVLQEWRGSEEKSGGEGQWGIEGGGPVGSRVEV